MLNTVQSNGSTSNPILPVQAPILPVLDPMIAQLETYLKAWMSNPTATTMKDLSDFFSTNADDILKKVPVDDKDALKAMIMKGLHDWKEGEPTGFLGSMLADIIKNYWSGSQTL